MQKVLILMSTYNGGNKIFNQVDSIMMQENVDIHINIRDDGSNENTIKILDSIKNKYHEKVNVIKGNNIGWKRSFLELVYCSDDTYDYYGFSDQDDIWLDKKVINCIKIAEEDTYAGPKLVHCNSVSVTPDLKERDEQEKRVAVPPSFKDALSTEYFQGCGMLWNSKAMKLIQSHRPENEDLAHDFWVGLVLYLFGKVYFCEEPQFYHIRYGDNSSTDGNTSKGRMKRFKSLFSGKNAYMNPAQDLINCYGDILPQTENEYLNKIVNYKNNLKYKMEILFDNNFRRPTLSATALFKVAILIDKY